MQFQTLQLLAALAVASLAAPSGFTETLVNKRLENGVGRTPALGWNSWVSIIMERVKDTQEP